jgi:hypothetical protein
MQTSRQVFEYLEALLAAGIYGRTLPEVAERLICQQIQTMNATPTLPNSEKGNYGGNEANETAAHSRVPGRKFQAA